MMNITVNLQNHRVTSDLVSPKNTDLSCCGVSLGEKRKRNQNVESYDIENCSVSVVLNNRGREEPNSGSRKLIHEANGSKEVLPNLVNTDQKMDRKQDAQDGVDVGNCGNLEVDNNSAFSDSSSEVAVQPKSSDCVSLKFNDFEKQKEEVNFAVGQTWALYDTTDGMPRMYAQIRKVSAPSFGLRITYLEPDPADEKEIQWFEEDLPVSVGKFRLGKNQNTKDRSIFSHLMQCNEGIDTDHFTVSPRKGETWALFKDWDIKWSSEPDSHRKYEYEFVEILSDYSDGAAVFVAYLHKAKGFASVFFRLGTRDADIFRILPHSLYRFSHRVPFIKLTGTEGKGMPKDAYELDQAALPETIEEITVPSNSESQRISKHQATYFASKGNVFQIGQIWSFYSGHDDLPLHYGKIKKITYTQAFKQEPVLKLHIGRLKSSAFPEDVIRWREGLMPVGCGTYYARNVLEIITSDLVSQQIMPQTSMDGKEYTILPKIGEVWMIYRYWDQCIEVERLDYCSYDIVEVLDDTLDNYEVLLLKRGYVRGDHDNYEIKWFKAVTEYTYNEEDGSEPIFTIPKSERLRFSHKVPAWRVTKEISGELNDIFKVDARALSINLLGH